MGNNQSRQSGELSPTPAVVSSNTDQLPNAPSVAARSTASIVLPSQGRNSTIDGSRKRSINGDQNEITSSPVMFQNLCEGRPNKSREQTDVTFYQSL